MHQQKQNNIMEKITVFKTLDGQMFEDENAAIAAEKMVILKKRLRGFANEVTSYSDQKDLIFNSIMENRSFLFEILDEYFTK